VQGASINGVEGGQDSKPKKQTLKDNSKGRKEPKKMVTLVIKYRCRKRRGRKA